MEDNIGQVVDAIAYIYRLREWLGEGIEIIRWWKMPTVNKIIDILQKNR
ncbi:MAG: hypothetical protein V7K97_10930 [Nostoc sp.]